MNLFARKIIAILEIMLAMSGVVWSRMTWLRVASILASLLMYGAMTKFGNQETAIWYFAAATLTHYVLLFGVFARQGWAVWFVNRYGEEEGFRRYEALMAFVFFHNGASTALACTASAGALYAYIPEQMLTACGMLFSCIGLPIKIWATMIVGIDIYYYRDLFLRRPIGEFRAEGPYKIFRNPMYGVGHLHGYGSALIAGSAMGLVMVAINQALVWSFYLTIEKPHVEAVFGAEER